MERLLLLIACILVSPAIIAQPYGNEWINYDQRYYKIPVHEDGVYRITFNDLANAGIPISGINPQHIQMYANGEPLPIYISV